jgi:glycosyltransferase involved in cell wall biosynthesis
LFVITFRQEAFGKTASDAQPCGTPVVAFSTGSLVAIVDHHVTSALDQPFDQLSSAAGIQWLLEDPRRRLQLGAADRQRAQRLWNPARVVGLYAEVFLKVLKPDIIHSDIK